MSSKSRPWIRLRSSLGWVCQVWGEAKKGSSPVSAFWELHVNSENCPHYCNFTLLSPLICLFTGFRSIEVSRRSEKPQDQIGFPAPTWVARPQSVRCNHKPDSSNHAGGAVARRTPQTRKKSCVAASQPWKTVRNKWPRLVVHGTKNDSGSRPSW